MFLTIYIIVLRRVTALLVHHKVIVVSLWQPCQWCVASVLVYIVATSVVLSLQVYISVIPAADWNDVDWK